jgi:hypothetical protein
MPTRPFGRVVCSLSEEALGDEVAQGSQQAFVRFRVPNVDADRTTQIPGDAHDARLHSTVDAPGQLSGGFHLQENPISYRGHRLNAGNGRQAGSEPIFFVA